MLFPKFADISEDTEPWEINNEIINKLRNSKKDIEVLIKIRIMNFLERLDIFIKNNPFLVIADIIFFKTNS